MHKLSRIALLSCASSFLFAADTTQVNRYATVENKPLSAQINPLLAVQTIHFPQTVKTVGEAMMYWLQYSGFHLAESKKLPESLKILMQQPLPQIDRNLGPLSIKTGLGVLVGVDVFNLIVNPISREVNFKRSKA
jgi:conjugative transfer region protein (TIGR03748 family)